MLLNLFSMFEPFFFFFSSISINMLLILVMYVTFFSNYISTKNIPFKNSLSDKVIYLFISLFLILMSFNLTGLLPWVMCNSSHMSLNLPLALSMWLMLLIWELKSVKMNLIINMTPKGSPLVLSFFLVFIETISKIIQPLTLSLRLTANMIAGHMIISLISSFIMISNFFSFSYFFLLLMVMFLELGVSMIQAYVFTFLLYLYSGQ